MILTIIYAIGGNMRARELLASAPIRAINSSICGMRTANMNVNSTSITRNQNCGVMRGNLNRPVFWRSGKCPT